MRKEDFPILSEKVHGRELVYLDNAATTQKPQAVLNAIVEGCMIVAAIIPIIIIYPFIQKYFAAGVNLGGVKE